VCSESLTCRQIQSTLPWRVTDSVNRGAPTNQPEFPLHPYSIVTFDLGIPPADRADHLLERAAAALAEQREKLRSAFHGHGLTLWIQYFYDSDGAIDFPTDAMHAFADLNVPCVFRLNPPYESKDA
jgi:hypothetical protein